MSWKAMTCASSNTICAGISRRMIWWKMVGIGSPESSGHLAARAERMRQRAAVDVFELAAQRHAMRQPAGLDLVLARELRQVVRGGFALDGGIGGDDQLAHFALAQARVQPVQPDLAWADAIERRQPALQHEVQPAVAGGLLDREPVGGWVPPAHVGGATAGAG